jgi:hypothetical protein
MDLFMQWPVLTFVGMVAVFGVVLATVSLLDLRSH